MVQMATQVPPSLVLLVPSGHTVLDQATPLTVAA